MPPSDFQSLADLARSFQAARALLTAVRIDLFTTLAGEALHIEELAARLGVDERALIELTNALVQLGILQREGPRYRNGPAAARYLNRDSGDSRVDVFLYTDNLWPAWSDLTSALEEGNPGTQVDWDDAALRSYARAMHQGKPDAGRELAARLELRGDEIVVDLGGGPGTFSEALAERLPRGRVVLVDRAVALDEARQRLPADLIETGRVRLEAANLFDTELARLAEPARGFDVALLSSVTHLFGPRDNARLLANLAAALEPDGLLAIRDFVMDDDSAAPLDAAMLSLTMLVTTPRGRCYTIAEYRGLLDEAGFAEPAIRFLEGAATLITARRR